jgi:hypothetical protein
MLKPDYLDQLIDEASKAVSPVFPGFFIGH